MFSRDASLLAALDHIHYVRSGLLFLNDMKQSPDSITEAFDQGNFTVKKTSRVFRWGLIKPMKKTIGQSRLTVGLTTS